MELKSQYKNGHWFLVALATLEILLLVQIQKNKYCLDMTNDEMKGYNWWQLLMIDFDYGHGQTD